MKYAFLITCFFVYVYASDESTETTEYALESATNAEAETETNITHQYYDYAIENRSQETDQNQKDRIKITPIMKITPPKIKTLVQQPERQDSSSELIWISRPFRQGLTDFRVRTAKNSLCDLQSALYEQHLKNNTLWAIQSEY